jgi:hypothetical protein
MKSTMEKFEPNITHYDIFGLHDNILTENQLENLANIDFLKG